MQKQIRAHKLFIRTKHYIHIFFNIFIFLLVLSVFVLFVLYQKVFLSPPPNIWSKVRLYPQVASWQVTLYPHVSDSKKLVYFKMSIAQCGNPNLMFERYEEERDEKNSGSLLGRLSCSKSRSVSWNFKHSLPSYCIKMLTNVGNFIRIFTKEQWKGVS